MKTAGTAPAPPDVFRDFGGFLLKKCDREATTRSTQKRRVTLPWQDPRIPLAEGNPYKFGGFSAMVSGHVFLLVTTPSHIIDRFWKLLIQYIYQWLGSPKTYGKLCFQDVKVSGWLPHNFQISNLIEFHTPINCHNRQYTYVYIYILWMSKPRTNDQSTSININQHQSTSININQPSINHQSTSINHHVWDMYSHISSLFPQSLMLKKSLWDDYFTSPMLSVALKDPQVEIPGSPKASRRQPQTYGCNGSLMGVNGISWDWMGYLSPTITIGVCLKMGYTTPF